MSERDLWIRAMIPQQESATRLLGDPPDPLADMAKKKQKKLQKQFASSSSSPIEVNALFTSVKASKKADESSLQVDSPEKTFLTSRFLKDSKSDKKDMKGLKDYVVNNESFPDCKPSTELKEKNMAAYCPEKIFVKKCIKRVNNAYESSSDIREAFDRFCHEVGVKSKPNISAYLEEHERLVKSKKRIDEDGQLTSNGNPIYVYEGIRLKKRYRTTGGELT